MFSSFYERNHRIILSLVNYMTGCYMYMQLHVLKLLHLNGGVYLFIIIFF